MVAIPQKVLSRQLASDEPSSVLFCLISLFWYSSFGTATYSMTITSFIRSCRHCIKVPACIPHSPAFPLLSGSLTFLEDNYDWMSAEAEKNWQVITESNRSIIHHFICSNFNLIIMKFIVCVFQTSDYWLAVKGLLAQLNGLLDGIKTGCPAFSHIATGDVDDKQHHNGVYLPSLTRNPSLIHLLLLNANGDLYQISDKYSQRDSGPTTDDSDDEVDHPFQPPKIENSRSMDKSNVRQRRSGRKSGSSAKEELERGPAGNIGESSTELFVNSGGEDIEINASKGRKLRSTYRRSRGGEVEGSGSRSEGVDHCSALIKLIPDKGGDKSKNDLIVGHNTWDDFQCAGPRIFKHYSLPLITGFTVPDTFSSGYNAGTEVPGESESEKHSVDASTAGCSTVTTGLQGSEQKRSVCGESAGITNRADWLRSRKSSKLSGHQTDDTPADDDQGYSNRDPNVPGDDDDSQSKNNNDRLEMHFSSSPGLLSSVDDFFTLSGRGEFIVLETT